MDDDPDIRGRLIDLYTRYGDKLTADQAAERGVSAEDHATFMMDMADEHRRERETLAEAAKTAPPDPEQIPPRRTPDEVRRIEKGEAERQESMSAGVAPPSTAKRSGSPTTRTRGGSRPCLDPGSPRRRRIPRFHRAAAVGRIRSTRWGSRGSNHSRIVA